MTAQGQGSCCRCDEVDQEPSFTLLDAIQTLRDQIMELSPWRTKPFAKLDQQGGFPGVFKQIYLTPYSLLSWQRVQLY